MQFLASFLPLPVSSAFLFSGKAASSATFSINYMLHYRNAVLPCGNNVWVVAVCLIDLESCHDYLVVIWWLPFLPANSCAVCEIAADFCLQDCCVFPCVIWCLFFVGSLRVCKFIASFLPFLCQFYRNFTDSCLLCKFCLFVWTGECECLQLSDGRQSNLFKLRKLVVWFNCWVFFVLCWNLVDAL